MGRRSSRPNGGREGLTGYDVSPIAIYVSKGRLCARLPYCPHRGWVSYESQPSRGNMARYRGIPYQDGSRGLPGRISPQVIPFRYSGYRPCFLDHFQISGDPTRSGGTGPRSPPYEPISPIDELSNIALGFGMLNTSHRRHTRRPAISPKMEWRRRDRSPRLLGLGSRFGSLRISWIEMSPPIAYSKKRISPPVS
jgi:hypothetical protein